MQTTKKPHGYHKIAVWQKDDRIRKSPLKFYARYYSILSGDCRASIITELWRLSVVFCVTLWHIIQEKFDTRSFFSARAYWYIRCIVWRISSSVVSGWIRQIRRTVRPFSWVVSTQAKPSSIMRREIVRPVAGGCEPLRRIAKFHNGQLRRRYNFPFRLVPKHGLRLLG